MSNDKHFLCPEAALAPNKRLKPFFVHYLVAIIRLKFSLVCPLHYLKNVCSLSIHFHPEVTQDSFIFEENYCCKQQIFIKV